MKRAFPIAILALFMSEYVYAQTNPLSAFENLIGSTWITEGTWENGSTFKQEQEFAWGLSEAIVKVKTYGTTDPEKNTYGLRNEGIRAWNASTKEVEFFEFDVFGGITSGKCIIEGNNIYYEYEYGGQQLRDAWIYKDADTYTFIIGTFENGKWTNKYQENEFKRVK